MKTVLMVLVFISAIVACLVAWYRMVRAKTRAAYRETWHCSQASFVVAELAGFETGLGRPSPPPHEVTDERMYNAVLERIRNKVESGSARTLGICFGMAQYIRRPADAAIHSSTGTRSHARMAASALRIISCW